MKICMEAIAKAAPVKVALVVFLGAPTILFSQSKIQNLEATIAKAKAYLSRVEDGAPPCRTKECQIQKGQTLSNIFTTYQSLSKNYKKFIPSLETGLDAAHFMVQVPFTKMPMEFPKSLKDWAGWWSRRYEYESQFRGAWLEFVNDTTKFYRAIDLWQKAAMAEESRNLIQEAWDRGAGDIATLTMQHSTLAFRAGLAERSGNAKEAEKLNAEARELRLQKEKLEANFSGSFREVIEELFPAAEFRSVLISMSIWKQICDVNRLKEIFSETAMGKVGFLKNVLKKISADQSAFSDLEYGVLGLKNFYSSTNPEVMMDFEAIIQEYLDKVDLGARIVTDIFGFLLMSEATNTMFASKFIRYAIPSGISGYMGYKQIQISESIWDPSFISTDLEAELPRMREEMAMRLDNLNRAHIGLIEKIQELEDQLKELRGE